MNTFHVYLRSDIAWCRKDIEAATPSQAVELARQLSEQDPAQLDEPYEVCDYPVNEVEVLDQHGNQLAEWQSDDLRLRLAAQDLLDAAELAVARWSQGNLADAVRQLDAAIAKAKGGAA
jgi:hypothetical protein